MLGNKFTLSCKGDMEYMCKIALSFSQIYVDKDRSRGI